MRTMTVSMRERELLVLFLEECDYHSTRVSNESRIRVMHDYAMKKMEECDVVIEVVDLEITILKNRFGGTGVLK